MRSRYSAYALKKADYIIETTHPNNPAFKQDKEAFRQEILHFCETTSFDKLVIVNAKDNWVHFIATLNQKPFEEKSYFKKVDGRWLYLDLERS